MLSKIHSATTVGLDGVLIKVEVDVASRGFPTFTIVGLPNKSIEESKERVRTAIHNSQFSMPESKIVVNLAPADIPKEGSLFDLPIAVGILASSGNIERAAVKNSLFVGELSLDGKIRPVPGVLPIAIAARNKKIQRMYLPKENAREASLIKELQIFPVDKLTDLVLHLNGHMLLENVASTRWKDLLKEQEYDTDFAHINGQKNAKHALEIAAAGGHNVHMKGPPGTGKTLLARAFPSILPPMDEEEIIEVSKIYSVTQAWQKEGFIVRRPFRAPHHTVSRVGLIGGGTKLTPGEISLSHRGVLFLDEFPEFPHSVLESLRQPMEDGKVTVTRASGTITFPARFILIAAANPCPCGFLGHPKKPCICSMHQILKYRKRVSGPILDRIDLHVDVPNIDEQEITSSTDAESSTIVRGRVVKARVRQSKRFVGSRIKSNAEMTSNDIKKYCVLEPEAAVILKKAFVSLSLSPRAYFKIIKIAQTLADLEGAPSIKPEFVSQALQFRVQEE